MKIEQEKFTLTHGWEKTGGDTAITGFYAYAEFSPSLGIAECQLYNQTKTITTLTEN